MEQATIRREQVISAQVPVALARQLKEIATEHDRTLSGEIRRALRAHVALAHVEREESAT